MPNYIFLGVPEKAKQNKFNSERMAKRKKSSTKKPILPFVVGGFFLWMLLRPKTASAGGGGNPLITTGGNGFTPTSGYNGSTDESYLGLDAATTPRGVRNNNPGNVKRSSSAWNGKIPFAQSTDTTFEQFEAYKYGVRVMIKLLKQNYIDAGYNTVDSLLRRYNPPGNVNYINWVAQQLGVGIHDTLTSDKNTLKKLVQALARWENGRTSSSSPEIVTTQQFETAWSIL